MHHSRDEQHTCIPQYYKFVETVLQETPVWVVFSPCHSFNSFSLSLFYSGNVRAHSVLSLEEQVILACFKCIIQFVTLNIQWSGCSGEQTNMTCSWLSNLHFKKCNWLCIMITFRMLWRLVYRLFFDAWKYAYFIFCNISVYFYL